MIRWLAVLGLIGVSLAITWVLYIGTVGGRDVRRQRRAGER